MSETPDTSPAGRLAQVAARPARLVPMICQMILGLALLIAIILKAYMVVLTDHQCVADGTSLGNLIRCVPMLDLMASILALSAGIELARCMFSETLDRVVAPIILALAAALLTLLAGVGEAGWRDALLILALVAAMGGIAWISKTFLVK